MADEAKSSRSTRFSGDFAKGVALGGPRVEKPLSALSRDTLEQRAYISIRTAIGSGEFAPGSIMHIGELAMLLDVSATPVREALKRLHAEQALEVLPSRALAVPTLNRARIEEIRDLRMLIEGFVTEIAAGKANSADCEYLKGLHQRMLYADEASVYLRLNREFHFYIYELAPFPMAHHVIDLLWLQSGPTLLRLITKAMATRTLKMPYDKQHEAIIEALGRGDGLAAGAAVRNDISTAAAFLIELIGNE